MGNLSKLKRNSIKLRVEQKYQLSLFILNGMKKELADMSAKLFNIEARLNALDNQKPSSEVESGRTEKQLGSDGHKQSVQTDE